MIEEMRKEQVKMKTRMDTITEFRQKRINERDNDRKSGIKVPSLFSKIYP
jgi:hypothetical protein